MLLRIRQRGHTDFVRDFRHTKLRRLITTGSLGTPLHAGRRSEQRRRDVLGTGGTREIFEGAHVPHMLSKRNIQTYAAGDNLMTSSFREPGVLGCTLAGISFVGGVAGAMALADSPYPRPGSEPAEIRRYFRGNSGAARLSVVSQLISAASLARFSRSVLGVVGQRHYRSTARSPIGLAFAKQSSGPRLGSRRH
jgi:hypothetical protein